MQEKWYTAKEIIKDPKDALHFYLRPEIYSDNCVQVMHLERTLALLSDYSCEDLGSDSLRTTKIIMRCEIPPSD